MGLQSLVLNAVAPLTAVVEANSKGNKVIFNTATTAMELVRSVNARIAHYRRTKIVNTLNRILLPLVEDKNLEGAAAGYEFAQESKDLIDQVKAM